MVSICSVYFSNIEYARNMFHPSVLLRTMNEVNVLSLELDAVPLDFSSTTITDSTVQRAGMSTEFVESMFNVRVNSCLVMPCNVTPTNSPNAPKTSTVVRRNIKRKLISNNDLHKSPCQCHLDILLMADSSINK